MYKIAGELLPGVMHVSARALAVQALSIFGDHQDVMACRQTGFAMLVTSSVQEVMDLAGVAHLAAIEASVPFMHFFDGFRTSHEIQKVEVMDYEVYKNLLNWEKVKEFKARCLNPNHPVTRGTAQNDDVYFQAREAQNKYYDAVPDIVAKYMAEISKVTGRDYAPFTYYGDKEATDIIIAMGSVNECIKEVVDYLNEKEGRHVGAINVHLYRPFSVKYLMDVLPASVKRIAVLDRTKEQGALGEPLFLDVRAAFYGVKNAPMIIGGRYGLSSKDTTPGQIIAVYDNLAKGKKALEHFTIGINDDVTHLSLPVKKEVNTAGDGATQLIFYGLGSDGTVGANKNSIKIIGDNTDNYAQAYFAYDSKKSGGITISHLRFGDNPIKSSYLIDQADFIACHNPAYVLKYDMLSDLKDGGTFLLNSPWTLEEMEAQLPASMKNLIAKKHAKFYNIDAIDVVNKIGLKGRISTTMQACFFKLANIMPYEEADKHMKDFVLKSFSKKGQAIVDMNNAAIDNAIANLKEINYPASWATTTEGAVVTPVTDDKYFTEIIAPMLAQEGDKLPVSAFVNNPDGAVPTGTTKFEKRGVAVLVPEWNPEKCIQCNQCAFVCPHATIRPVMQKEFVGAPATFKTAEVKVGGAKGYQYRMQVSALDCLGCGSCAKVCPVGQKAQNEEDKPLRMVPLAKALEAGEDKNWEYAVALPETDAPISKDDVKGSQFRQPLFEFSGACAGCGETPYLKVISQMFGDRMIVANATGCSSIYGGSAPTCPYTKNAKGHGPAWANSLFEDNAEFGYGMEIAVEQRRKKLAEDMAALIELGIDDGVKGIFEKWMETAQNTEENKVASEAVKGIIADLAAKEADATKKALFTDICKNQDCLVKKSVWIFGGDGWAYDIGFGGLDHVLAMNRNVNVMVLDTEVYSNTGGQASKSSPTGAIAKFAAGGKMTKKKDLGKIAMSYGYVYVAQVSMGASPAQFLKAIREAEAYDGPSLIIGYAPCINHGLKDMGASQLEMKKAVETGYWQLYRFNPAEGGKFYLDSKEPTGDYKSFLMGENRYAQLAKAKPEVAEKLFALNEEQAKARYEGYKKLSE